VDESDRRAIKIKRRVSLALFGKFVLRKQTEIQIHQLVDLTERSANTWAKLPEEIVQVFGEVAICQLDSGGNKMSTSAPVDAS
jgi:hypothetical protein